MEVSRIYFILCFIFYIFHTCKTDTEHQEKSIFDLISEATLGEDGKFNFTQLVNKYGHSVKQYDIQTEDGYILTIFNIPGNKTRPVLLLHGLLDSCDTFVIRGNTSLGITLANADYDVWVGNGRGNLYGRRHVSLDPDKDEKFWEYSFHEIGYYDLPAMIDHVRAKTGAEKISTIGHSQGTTAHFVLTSLRPEYNQRIKIFIALAPVAYMNNVGVAIAALADASPVLVPLFKSAGINELFKDGDAASDFAKLVCSKGIASYIICGGGVIFPLIGFDLVEIEPEYLTKVAIGHFPRAISRKCFAHYSQVVYRKKFAQYDYGNENESKYGSKSPPEYNLESVKINVALFTGGLDLLATVKDVVDLRKTLPNIVYDQVIGNFGHLAFVSGKNMPKYLFPNVMRLLEEYN